MLELIVLAVALAMDAVAVAAGIGATQRSWGPVVLGALLFGAFQAGMSGLGWWGGVQVEAWAAAWDHWIAFVLLVGIGLRTIHGALTEGDEEDERASHGVLGLLGLAVATSIDALAAGITLPMLDLPGPVTIGTIGLVTLVLALAGGALGRALGDAFGPKVELAGGVVLIGIGVKVLVEHLITGI